MAFCSARLPAESGPPSRAATMIARDSFEKSLPRFASAAPFLCLIDDHLLCPDTRLLPYELQDPLAAVLGEHLHPGPGVRDARRADEDASQRLVVAGELQVGLEARDLAAVRVALHLDVDEPEVLPVEQDHPGAGPEHGPREAADRLFEP